MYLQGKDWHITAAEELSGKELSHAHKLYNLQEQVLSAKVVLEHLAQSLAVLALEVNEAQPPEKVDASVSTHFAKFLCARLVKLLV